jgi:hypothetical protein
MKKPIPYIHLLLSCRYYLAGTKIMIKFIEMDEKVTLSAQMEENAGPVILINKFNVKPEDVNQLLKDGQPMLRTSNNSQVSFLHNFIAALVVAVIFGPVVDPRGV